MTGAPGSIPERLSEGSAPMAFEKEKVFFSQHRHEWLLGHAGKLAVIRDEKVVGFFASIEDAYEGAVRSVGDRRFLIVRITGDGAGRC